MSVRILIVDDDPDIRETVRLQLGGEFQFFEADNGTVARKIVETELPSLVLLDLSLPDEGGTSVLSWLRQEYSGIETIIISGTGSIGVALECIKLGAFDYLEKPIDTARLQVTVQNALERARMSQSIAELRAGFRERPKIIGNSKAMEKVFDLIELVGPSDASILITGESGVGKELVTDAVQRISKRKENAYVKLNCAAIPIDLIESELFGHEKGSFTGATASKDGQFEMADGGTLFLDEIGDMGLMTQAKMLRFLQYGEVQRVGGTSMKRVDVRIISASNKNLQEEIKEKRFRQDLFYRLNVISIDVPPLRERKEDIPGLVAHFIEKWGTNKGYDKKDISPEALFQLENYDWPGNVRELENVVQRSIILSKRGVIQEIDIPMSVEGEKKRRALSTKKNFSDRTQEFSHDIIVNVLETHGWNQSATARHLGLHRNTLLSRMKKLGIYRSA